MPGDVKDAVGYAIKVYYSSSSDTAKKAAELDDEDYRLDINDDGMYNSSLLAPGQKIADDGNEGIQDLDESNGDEGGVVVT